MHDVAAANNSEDSERLRRTDMQNAARRGDSAGGQIGTCESLKTSVARPKGMVPHAYAVCADLQKHSGGWW